MKRLASVRSHRKFTALITSVIGLFMVIGPYGSIALANHPTTACLDVTPETDINPTIAPNNVHTVTATMRATEIAPPPPSCTGAPINAGTGGGVGAVKISFEIDGPNDPDNDGDTPETPDEFCVIPQGEASCQISYPGTQTGTDEIRGWIDHDGEPGVTEADATEGQDETDLAQVGSEPEPDDTDVVTKTWDTTLECTPETDINDADSGHSITCSATGGANPAANANVDAEATGANDPDNSNSPSSPDFTCTTDNTGSCTFTHGPGGTGTTNSVGITTYRVWIDADGVDNTVEADTTEGRDEGTTPGAAAEPDETDVVEKTWTARLDCEPDTDSNPVGTGHTVTCHARDTQNDPVEGAQVDVEATGANDPDSGNTPQSPDFTCTTGNSGQCTFDHGPNTNSTGTTTYRAWIDLDNDNSTTEADATEGRDEGATPGADAEPDDTDVVEKTWVPNPARTISLDVNKEDVVSGTKVRFFGSIDGHPACEAGQTVRLRAARPGKKLRTVATVVSDPDGSYDFSLVVTKTRDYRTVTPATVTCDRAKSNKVRVRVL